MITSIDQLKPDAATCATRLLEEAVSAAEPGLRDEVRDALTAHLCELLGTEATVAEVEALVASFGPVTGAERSGLGAACSRLCAGFSPRGLAKRIAATSWNPAEPRVLMPRAVGLGWDINFGAVAVRLGLIEPDAETEPFTATPEADFRLMAALPLGLATATVLHYVVRGPNLPERLPSHWNLMGVPDRWVPKPNAAATDIAVTAVSAGVGVWAALSSRPGPTRAGALAMAAMLGAVGASNTVLRSLDSPRRAWAAPALLGPSVLVMGGVLLWLARAGRAAEIAKDLQAGR